MKKVFYMALSVLFVAVAICSTTVTKADKNTTAKVTTEKSLLMAKTDPCCASTCHSVTVSPPITPTVTAMITPNEPASANAKTIGAKDLPVCSNTNQEPDVSAMVATTKKENSTSANIDTGPNNTANAVNDAATVAFGSGGNLSGVLSDCS